jgi:DNA (cytosine-5)-methyltransferase 1
MGQIRLFVSDDNDKIFVCGSVKGGSVKGGSVKGGSVKGGSVKDGYTKIDFICPLTGKAFKKRGDFWNYMKDSNIQPQKMTYDRQTNVENEENISKLFDKTHFKYLWVNYFEKKKNNKLLENLVGQINLELYIILLKVYNGDMDIDECISKVNLNVSGNVNGKVITNDTIQAISLFSGMGGDSLGIVKAGLNLVAYSEWEKEMKETHELNFPDTKLLGEGDITKTNDNEFLQYKDKVNLIFAGFPCQGFSHAGKKLPDDPRNTLFREFLRSTRLIKPKYIIGENVKGLISRKNVDGDLYIDIIKDEFNKIGYDIYYKVYMCSKLNIGVPQNRERLIIVGIRSDLKQVFNFPEESDDRIGDLKNIIKFNMDGALKMEPDYLDFDLNDLPKECILTDMDNEEEENKPHPNLVQLAKKRDYVRKDKARPHRLHFGRRLDVGGEIIDIRKPINTIICSYAHCPRFFVPLKNKNGNYLRCLLPVELKQIQGFPEDYKLSGDIGKQIKQIGNAVPPPLIEMIVNSLKIHPKT